MPRQKVILHLILGGNENENFDQLNEKSENNKREPENSCQESYTHYFNKPQLQLSFNI